MLRLDSFDDVKIDFFL